MPIPVSYDPFVPNRNTVIYTGTVAIGSDGAVGTVTGANVTAAKASTGRYQVTLGAKPHRAILGAHGTLLRSTLGPENIQVASANATTGVVEFAFSSGLDGDIIFEVSTPAVVAGGSAAPFVVGHIDTALAGYTVSSAIFTPATTDTNVDADEFWTLTLSKRLATAYATPVTVGTLAASAGFTAFTPQPFSLVTAEATLVNGAVLSLAATEAAGAGATPGLPAGTLTVRLRRAALVLDPVSSTLLFTVFALS